MWVTLGHFSDFWQHAREDFEAEVLLVSKSVGSSLDDADLVVDSLDQPQRASNFTPRRGGFSAGIEPPKGVKFHAHRAYASSDRWLCEGVDSGSYRNSRGKLAFRIASECV